MKIIIVGAGRVGTSVAEALVSEANDITVIDIDGARVAELQNRFDLRGLVGNAALPSTLQAGGAADADMLIAVTAYDETNLVACKSRRRSLQHSDAHRARAQHRVAAASEPDGRGWLPRDGSHFSRADGDRLSAEACRLSGSFAGARVCRRTRQPDCGQGIRRWAAGVAADQGAAASHTECRYAHRRAVSRRRQRAR